jgi:hypothetical protein
VVVSQTFADSDGGGPGTPETGRRVIGSSMILREARGGSRNKSRRDNQGPARIITVEGLAAMADREVS